MKFPNKRSMAFLPLGGTGEIGMNLNLYLHDDSMLMVDCGLMFEDPDEQLLVKDNQVIVPDIRFVAEHRDRLTGIVITHAHEDHIGALPLLWDQMRVPVYTTPFTAEVLRRKCRGKQRKVLDYLVEVKSFETYVISGFEVTWIPMTHSTLEGHGLIIRTAVGTVFHTGDWKLDRNPGLGIAFSEQIFRRITSEKPSAIIGDSTNALKAGHSHSELEAELGLKNLVKRQPGRVLVSCFASNISRLVALARVAQATKRYLCLLGRSLENMHQIARSLAIWPDSLKVYPASEIAYLPKHETLIVATGSQGEPRAALARLARNSHPLLELETGDSVIFSSMRIPGNELAIDKLVHAFKAQGVHVFEEKDTDETIHASGHPNQEELELLYTSLQPSLCIPTHGTPEHMNAHALIAKKSGVRRQLTGKNGDLFRIFPSPHCSRDFCQSGRVVIENQ